MLDLQVHLLDHPDAGAVIPGAHGLRKPRWAGSGRGKRGGLRVIYYWMNAQGVIVLARLYAKNEQENLTTAETRDILRQIKP